MDLKTFDFIDDGQDLLDGKFIIHCPTEELAQQFCNQLDQRGFKWASGASLKNTNWNNYREKMCYNVQKNKDVAMADLPFYLREYSKNKKILVFIGW